MPKVLLLALGAAWAAVVIPAVLRSRVENRPNSSVTDFRRQLSSLQRTVPTRQMGARSMARPLVQSPQRSAAAMRSIGAQAATNLAPAHHRHTAVAAQRRVAQPGVRAELDDRRVDSRRVDPRRDATGGQRRVVRDIDDGREFHGHRQAHLQRPSVREANRRRRTNVLFMLVVANAATAFLAATTKSTAMVYAFAIAFIALCGFCYLLVQIRNNEMDRRYGERSWFNAA